MVVTSWAGRCKVTMTYFGSLSVNRYKIPGTRTTRPEVKEWMQALAGVLSSYYSGKVVRTPVLIRLSGTFTHSTPPDIHNLHKVIGDAVEMGLGINDREYRFLDEDVVTNSGRNTLVIEVAPYIDAG